MANSEKQFDIKATLDENLRMGFIELLILQLLTEEDKYGYQLKQEISEKTDSAVTFQEGTLYVPLLRMASRGLVSSRKEYVVGKRFRTYYHIEDLGREYLAYGKEQCKIVFNGITNLLFMEEHVNEEQ